MRGFGFGLLTAVVMFPIAAVGQALDDTCSPGGASCPCDDVTSSLGGFIIWVEPTFRSLVSSEPGWDAGSNQWSSPVMLDTATTIGRSCVHLDGDSTDTGGATVGVAGTNVSDSSFALVPTGDFTEGPGGTREVHTELRSMNLVADACPALCTGTGNGVPITVRAGVGTGVALATVGEVETLPGGGDFPAESFFDVFVEIDTPFFGGTTLANSASNPLLVVDPALDALPPKVVYIHGETNAVPVSFVDGPSAGQVFGYLRLAGHGAGFVANCGDNEFFCVDVVDFAAQLAAAPLMPCPQCIATPVPATGVTAKIVLVLVATAGLLFVVRSRGPAQA